MGKEISLIAAVCAKSMADEFIQIKGILIKIAEYLQWQLIEEETDYGAENYIHWEPQPRGGR